ncbi:YceI family protein [Elizabethkingia argentiflava]|uniref:YceI family protein n=1 Tax=Elizabethkingia argenteiflava TaxID=2681556 RepID=A0A845PW04_9FLAO|nr:YceI family protein [Elizabethkingia argenteiflava]NAW50290.1 YceI family protein [Elizabethkingia argenteiflava]
MRQTNIFLTVVTVIGLVALVSCRKDKPVTSEFNEVTTSKDGVVFSVDTLDSRVEWVGYKIFKSNNTSHFGNIKLESGEVSLKDGKLESGNFVVSMNTITADDLKNNVEKQAKLDAHLKSADFFDVKKFPTASFEITKVIVNDTGDYNTRLEGNLTIKGITKPISLDTNVREKDGLLTIKSNKKDINRRDFGVDFTSPVAKGIIKDEISIQVNVKALEKK